MKAIKRESPNNTELTYEKLKQYKGFENITETESEKMIAGIKKLAKILYYLYEYEQQQENKTDNENRP